MKMDFYFKTDKSLGITVDEETGEYGEAYIKLTVNSEDYLMIPDYPEAVQGFKKMVADNLNVSSDLIYPITKEEYGDDEEEPVEEDKQMGIINKVKPCDWVTCKNFPSICGQVENVSEDGTWADVHWLTDNDKKNATSVLVVKKNYIVKEFGPDKDFYSEGGALTLDPTDIGSNSSGWMIAGRILEDYYEWVNEFTAYHKEYGNVWGNFEYKVYADSEIGYQHFMKYHEPNAWDYGDI